MSTALEERLLITALDEGREVKAARQLMMELASRRRETIFGLHMAGVSLREIAAKIGCSPSVVQNAIRHAKATRPPIELQEDRISYELHRALAEKLGQDPVPVIEHGRRNTEQMLQDQRDSRSSSLLEHWSNLLSGDVEDLIAAMLAPGRDAGILRQASPFVGALSMDERRLSILKAVATAP